MHIQAVVVFLVLYLYHVSASDDLIRCPPNEEWNNCDTRYPLTCQNQTRQNFVGPCIRRCSCKKGFIRERPGGRCVPESCQSVCKENEEYSLCASRCPSVCNQKPRNCIGPCIRGCVCKKGYIRSSSNGKCIPKLQCKPNCGRNEEYKACGTSCPKICNETMPKICSALCVGGCFCKESFIREKRGGWCVPDTQCQPKCGPNQEYSKCGSACPRTCSQPLTVCEKKCVKGCFCKRGYLLDKDGKCIKRDRCPR